MIRRLLPLALCLCALFAVGASAARTVWLPTDWTLTPPTGAVATTGTFPQGLALSPDRTKLAVVEGGYNPPALRILRVPDLRTLATIPLKDAFGAPLWRDATHVAVPGGATNAILVVDTSNGTIAEQPASAYVSAVARDGNTLVAGTDTPTEHDAAIAVHGSTLYVADRGAASVVVRGASGKTEAIAVDLHPAALALSNDGTKLFVACSDADTVDVVDTASGAVVDRIDVGVPQGPGASPNALAVARNGTLYVSLGAQNAVAEIRNGRVIARAPAGWYPTGLAVDGRNVYVTNGRGEGSRANPQFDPEARRDPQYVASAMSGSVRAIARTSFDATSTAAVFANMPVPVATPAQTIVRANGPIKHVIYIIKENRTYDEVLGDLPKGDGDPKLVWFGANVTPNEHAMAMRFGIFDRTFTDAQVSASGHNWSTAAFANDYTERFWPPNYGGRRKAYDFQDGFGASTPGTGYLWDDADKHGVSLRDYGEYASEKPVPLAGYVTGAKGLKGRIDPRYPGFDLTISDETRIDEWEREFKQYVRDDDLPALEIVWLPNDHTSGTRPGALTPQAYNAQNDHAFGRLVDAVSHSKYWASTAIFSIEDDSQNGPDHVDDQRTTFYLISPYAAPGVHHAHYTTSSVLHTIELLLGLPPMTIYDRLAPPMYDAFALRPDLRPYDVIAPKIDVTARNEKTAYGAAESARMDWADEDAQNERELNDILAHAAEAAGAQGR